MRSVGYRGIAVPGLPFDEKSGHVPNDAGRVTDGPGKPALPGQFVVGWAKRGPSGLIGTNRADSVATVKALLEDWKASSLPARGDVSLDATLSLMKAKGLRPISFADWQKLDKLERERGAASGKIREKFASVEEMLAALAAAPSAA